MVFVTFTNYLHDVHILFIINCYTEFTLREANKINFFIIAQMPKGVWALLIFRVLSIKEKSRFPNPLLSISFFLLFFLLLFLFPADGKDFVVQ